MLISAKPPRLGVLSYTTVVLRPSFHGWTLQTQRPLRLSSLPERQLPRVLVGALTYARQNHHAWVGLPGSHHSSRCSLPLHFPSLHSFLPVPTLFSFFLVVLLFLESGHTYKIQQL